jgi:hypothetical protein
MPTLLESIQHLDEVVQNIILTEAPQGWLIQTEPEAQEWLGNTRQYFVDLGFEDWPNAATIGNIYLTYFASEGLAIPNTNLVIRSLRTHEIAVEVHSSQLSLPDDWRAYVQLADFHRDGEAIVWFGSKVRPDRRPSDIQNFIEDNLGYKRIAG